MARLSWLVRQPAFVGVLALFALPPALAGQVGTVQAEQKISETEGGFGGVLDSGDKFGTSVSSLGDLDNDGNEDLAVGAERDDDGGVDQGAVWILSLNSDGLVATEQKISETAGGFGGVLDPGDFFGKSVVSLGDLDNDGIADLAVGAYHDDDGGSGQGAVWILFLNSDGTVASEQKISETAGGFGGVLEPNDHFGFSVAPLGDLDNDGTVDLAVSAVYDDDGGSGQGAVWILFLNSDGTVASEQKISETAGGFGGVLDPSDNFGISVASLGDLDNDGIEDLAVGAYGDDAVWILFLNSDGTVASEQKISETEGGFGGVLQSGDKFGFSVAPLGDLDNDGTVDLAAGAQSTEGAGLSEGAVWILFLNSDGTVASEQKISETAGGFDGVLDQLDFFGNSVAALSDLDGDGTGDIAVGALGDDDGGTDQGAVWILFLEGSDTTPPAISCPPAISVIDDRSGLPGETVFFTVTASDNRDPAPSVVCVPPSGSYFARGTTIVTCTATDLSGNQSYCMFPVLVVRSCQTPPSCNCAFMTQEVYGTVSGPLSVAASDLDNDGHRDLAAVTSFGGVKILFNNGSGTFAVPVTYATGSGSYSVAIKDLNGDGNRDLAVANQFGDSVSVLLNSGNGSFIPHVSYAVGDQPVFVAIEDLDGDGDHDLAVANLLSNNVSVLKNAGDGAFAPQVSYATEIFPQSIAIADMDGDGDRDLAVANRNSNSVSVLHNFGNGTFSAQLSYATGFAPFSVAAADLDGDNDNDLAVANWQSNTVSVLLNPSNGMFASQVSYATGPLPSSVAIADLDDDGDRDLVVANQSGGSLSVLLNSGGGAFAAQVTYGAGSTPLSVAVADLDGDRDRDLVVANFGSSSVSVLRNLCRDLVPRKTQP